MIGVGGPEQAAPASRAGNRTIVNIAGRDRRGTTETGRARNPVVLDPHGRAREPERSKNEALLGGDRIAKNDRGDARAGPSGQGPGRRGDDQAAGALPDELNGAGMEAVAQELGRELSTLIDGALVGSGRDETGT